MGMCRVVCRAELEHKMVTTASKNDMARVWVNLFIQNEVDPDC